MNTRPNYLREWLAYAVGLVLLGGAIGIDSYRDCRHIEDAEKQRLASQVTVMNDMIAHQFNVINNTLVHLRGHVANSKKDVDFDDVNERLKALEAAMSGVHTFIITDALGTVIASSRDALVGQNFRMQDCFQMPLKNPNPDTLYVSTPFRTSSGIWSMNLTRTVAGKRGAFAGIVTASIDPAEFRILLNSVRYRPDMWTALIHGSGRVVHARA